MAEGSGAIAVSIVVPVYNEKDSLPELRRRLTTVVEGLDRSYEIVLVDDGSRDGTLALLLEWQAANPERIVVLEFVRNFGQHVAVIAGMEASRGARIVTLDADLQNPPEEIPKLLDLAEQGYDLVRGVRRNRQDTLYRRAVSVLSNVTRAWVTGIRMEDHGCMMAVYDRALAEVMVSSRETSPFIPTLAAAYAGRSAEIVVEHARRAEGKSKHNFLRLIRFNFDLLTSSTAAPLHAVTIVGMLTSLGSLGLVLYLALRRLIVGSEAQGMFTLFGIAFFMIGMCLFATGIMGEYVARIYQEVRNRPLYVVRRVHRREATEPRSAEIRRLPVGRGE